jgi:hypothetical protein
MYITVIAPSSNREEATAFIGSKNDGVNNSLQIKRFE